MRKDQKELLEQIRKSAEKIEEYSTDAGLNASAANEYALMMEVTERAEARGALVHGIQMTTNIAKEIASDIEGYAVSMGRTAEKLLQDPIEDGHTPTEAELRELYSDKRTNAGEDKKRILYRLTHTLKATRAGANVQKIEITDDQNTAIIRFDTGAWKDVNIEADSGIAMIIDICRALM